MRISKLAGLAAGPGLFTLCLMFFHPEGLSTSANAVLAVTVWMAIWWIVEVVPISVTALLPIVLFPLTGGLNLESATASFGHKYIFLYMGGFMIAIAIERWNLHKRIALNIILLIGTDISLIILGFMLATAFMSMWISNTATSVMMLPIGLAIIAQLKDNPHTPQNEHLIFGKALMLGIAYSASIGGMGTLIGTPPNLVLAGIVQELYGVEISFAQWSMFGIPISMALLAICWLYITRYAFTFSQKAFPGGRKEIRRLIRELGVMSFEEKMVFVVFVCTAILWMFRSPLQNLLPALSDSIIAIMAGVSLFFLPTKDRSRPLLTWEEAVKLPWGIILLFGGGMALAEGFMSSGLADWIGSQLSMLEALPIFLLILILITSINFLTEITSNLATIAMVLPILAPMALVLDIHPYLLMVAATTAASCAFMLPVATPPNAVVFGSGYLKISDMVRVGVWMNILSILILSVIVYVVLPWLWGFMITPYPNSF